MDNRNTVSLTVECTSEGDDIEEIQEIKKN